MKTTSAISDIAAVKRSIAALQVSLDLIAKDIMAQTFTSTKPAQVTALAKRFIQMRMMKDEMTELGEEMLAAMPRNHGAALTEEDRQEIRGLFATGLYTQVTLARHYDVAVDVVYKLVAKVGGEGHGEMSAQQMEIFNKYQTGNITQQALAEEYHVTQSAISATIIKGRKIAKAQKEDHAGHQS